MLRNKSRYYSLDFIKIIAIFLVCFYHFTTISRNFMTDKSIMAYINYYIYGLASVCVPLFFMVNGALMLNKDYDMKKHIKKIVTLLILIFSWGGIQLIIYAPLRGDTYTWKSFIYAILNWTNERIDSLWFLQTLICIYIIFPIIKEIYDKEDKTLLKYTLLFCGFVTFGIVFINMIVNVIQWMNGKQDLARKFFNILVDPFNPIKGFRAYSLFYFISGGILFNKLKENKFKISNNKLIIAILLSLLFLFMYGCIMSVSNNKLYDTVWNGYDTIMTFIICVSIFVMAFRMEEKLENISSIISLVGSNTLGIYLLQGMVGAYLHPFYKQLNNNGSIIMNIVFAITIMMVSLLITLIIKKIPILKKLLEL